MVPASSAKIGSRAALLPLLVLLLILSGMPACLAVDSADVGAFSSGPNRAASADDLGGLRDRLRAAVRPVFELSVLLVLGLAAVVTVALRCRRTERARIRNLRQLRLLSSFENDFPTRLSAELRGILARVAGRSELLLESDALSANVEQTRTIARGLRSDAETLRLLLKACSELESTGPALKSGRSTAVDLGGLLARLSDTAIDPGPTVRSDPALLELALALLLRIATPIAFLDANDKANDNDDSSGEAADPEAPAISIHVLPARSPNATQESGDDRYAPREYVLLSIRSGANHTLPGLDAGLALAERTLLSVGGRLRITTEHSQGSTIEVELPK
ncbi:MAG: hypothetical protein NXI24_04320 [bacterium]|nr:hypothetical protein [bacterium]